MNSKLRFALIGFTIGLLAGIAIYFFVIRNQKHELVFTETKLQTILNEHFPVSQDVTLAKIEYSNPKISLSQSSDRMSLQMEVTGSLFGSKFAHGNIAGTWTTKYEPEDGAVYFTDLKIDEIKFDGAPNDKIAIVNRAAEPFLRDRLGKILIYKLKDNEFSSFLARRTVKKSEVKDGKLVIQFGAP